MVKQKLVGNWFSLESISHDILWLIFKFLYFILSFMLRRVAYFLHYWKLTNITSNNTRVYYTLSQTRQTLKLNTARKQPPAFIE